MTKSTPAAKKAKAKYGKKLKQIATPRYNSESTEEMIEYERVIKMIAPHGNLKNYLKTKND
jgi:hypothetical protein